MAKYPKKKDMRMTVEMDKKLNSMAVEMSKSTGLTIKTSDILRAALSRYITAYDAGELAGTVHEEFSDGKTN